MNRGDESRVEKKYKQKKQKEINMEYLVNGLNQQEMAQINGGGCAGCNDAPVNEIEAPAAPIER
ncbi:MAG: hypothetical protein GY757_61135 [bacterium]|nr:hypothetical protein [bacterium]